MGLGIQWVVDKITFPSPPSSYSLTSHPELFFVKNPKKGGCPGVPCMLYTIPQGAPVLLVHAHSNGCDIGDMRQTLQSISDSLRVHVMSFEFPGYGLHVGSASMRSIDEAAAIVLGFIVDDLKVNPAQVVWYGRSIGTGPSLRVAHRLTKESRQPGGVVLQCGFANFKEVAGHLFGRVAKSLVSPLWPNEAMVKELRCPVLLIHGRADKMIPIEHSQRLWEAVSLKDLSRFHACDCGHNDFNFQRCTLRPIYDFLLGVISAPNFPTTNFHLEIGASSHAFVHHIGPLRAKIPVYSFRRPELEEWMRQLQHKKEIANGSSVDENQAQPDADGEKLEGQSAPTSPGPAPAAAPSKKKKGKKGEQAEQPPAIPNLAGLPPIKDVVEALGDPSAMVQTCAARVDNFLDRIQKQLNRIEGLENKPVEEVIDFVEAEFWACDPLLCLWEEVSIPRGELVRIRLGPFFVESSGRSGYDPSLGSGSERVPNLLRVPIWIFCPSSAHFRCLAEWSLLHSERLERSLPSGAGAHGSTCCCAPCTKIRGRGRAKSKKPADANLHPPRGVLATSLAAHFANWVDKTEEVKAIFRRFIEFHRSPGEFLAKAQAAGGAAAGSAPAASDAAAPSAWRPPWQPGDFSAAARALLREGAVNAGLPGATLAEHYGRLWGPDAQPLTVGQLRVSLDQAAQGPVPQADKNTDWFAGTHLLQYERLLCGIPMDDRESQGAVPGEEAWGDPLRKEMQAAGLGVSRSMKVFAHTDHRERREHERARRPAALAARQPAPDASPSDAMPLGEEDAKAEPGSAPAALKPPAPLAEEPAAGAATGAAAGAAASDRKVTPPPAPAS